MVGADGLDAPAFVARPARALLGGSGRPRRGRAHGRPGVLAAGRVRALWRRGAARRRAGGRAGWRVCGRAGSLAIFIWPCRAMLCGAALPCQDGWRGRPYHVNRQPFRSSPCQPLSRLTRPKILVLKKNWTVLDLKLVFKKILK